MIFDEISESHNPPKVPETQLLKEIISPSEAVNDCVAVKPEVKELPTLLKTVTPLTKTSTVAPFHPSPQESIKLNI